MAYKQKNNPFKSRKPGPILQGHFGQTEFTRKANVFNPIEGVDEETEYKELGDKTLHKTLSDLERDVDKFLDYPQKKAEKISEEIGGYEDAKGDVTDRFRHTMAAAYTSDRVGIIGANLLGLAHEAIAPNTPGEHKSDLINNAIGSVVGSIPFINEDQMVSTVKWLNDRGWLSSYENKEGEERRKDYLNPNREKVDLIPERFDMNQLKALIENIEIDLEEEE